MDQTDASALIAYNFWANDRILSTCERLPVDDFTRVTAPAILTGYGQSPGELDFDLFLAENPEHTHP